MVKTFGKWLPFVILLTSLPLSRVNVWGKASAKGHTEEAARVTISVYNDAEVLEDVIGRGEKEASNVFWKAGIQVKWLNCRLPAISEEASRACLESVFPEHLHLRIVRRSLSLRAETMGISFLGADEVGCFADLFYEPMEDLHKSDGTDLAVLLGHVAAHEIGHLLLRTNSHSAAGIMHAHWTTEELAIARVGGLVFSQKESRRMKAKLISAIQASKEATAETIPRAGD